MTGSKALNWNKVTKRIKMSIKKGPAKKPLHTK